MGSRLGERGHILIDEMDIDPDRAIAQMARETGLSVESADEVFGDLYQWMSDSRSIRAAQLNGWDNWARAQADNIEAYIERAPKWGSSGTTYRGLSLTDEQLRKMLRVGFDVDDGALASWTSGFDVAERFSYGRNKNKVILRSRTQRHGVSVTHIVGGGEREVIASGKAQHRVVKWEYDEALGAYVVDVEEP